MANRTYLLEAKSPIPWQGEFPEKDILVAANNSIPIFWYALFQNDCIIARDCKLEDGTNVSYPYLVSTIEDARRRCLARRNSLLQVFPQSFSSTFDAFHDFLASVTSTHIHLDPLELWMMDEPEKFLPHVKRCVAAVERPDDTSREWGELLDQVQIDPNDIASTTESYMLAGYSWERPVTWE